MTGFTGIDQGAVPFDARPSDVSPDRSRILFARTMALVALAVGLFAFGAYVGRDLSGGAGIVGYLASFACLIGMSFAVRRSRELSVALLAGFGLLTGIATAPVLAVYASADPAALWHAAIATGLFVAGFGAWGYATRRDLRVLARVGFWALLGLIVFGIVLAFVQIPAGAVIYSVIGLLIFAALTMVDFQRLRRLDDLDSAPLLAASIFLDVLNVFLLFLDLFSSNDN